MNSIEKGNPSMARPVRQTGINGARLRHLRRQEQWTQTDLANRLGVHRATLARWEAGDGDPPYEVADLMAKLFKVPPGYFFEFAPVPDEEGENPDGVILDPVLKRFPLAKLQKFTRPALRALGLSLTQLARKLPTLTAQRIQELMEGQKPTAYEIQLLRSNLGPDFHPTSSMKNRILAPGVDAESSAEQWNALQHRIARMEQSLETVTELQKGILQQMAFILERLPQV
jgi:transcriptional regulator with XRE-family HTH domain